MCFGTFINICIDLIDTDTSSDAHSPSDTSTAAEDAEEFDTDLPAEHNVRSNRTLCNVQFIHLKGFDLNRSIISVFRRSGASVGRPILGSQQKLSSTHILP